MKPAPARWHGVADSWARSWCLLSFFPEQHWWGMRTPGMGDKRLENVGHGGVAYRELEQSKSGL